ncbi:hypothetical protein HPP92_010172 [Vanilla planifolia]|uniref:Uncharacterized protein n=1 Tax=Vanilla planifolia TaxID=51239 RepID=A0A835QV55_VANPL|nr:hypothetical protein HPP92_010172 [Vanilla planifolia]
MSSAAASKRALLAEDVHGERLLVVIGPCQGSTRTRFSFSPMPYQQLCPRSHEGETGSGGTGIGHWVSSPGPQSIFFDTESQSSSRDMRGLNVSFDQSSSFSSNDTDQQFRFVEPAYSFVGMHCVFDNCKASVIQQLKGPSKGITASRGTSSCVKDRSNIKEPNMRKNLQNYDKDGDLQNVVSFYITGQPMLK